MRTLKSHSPVQDVSESDIQLLEQSFETKLPDQYKDFLHTNNGAWVEDEDGFVNLPNFGELNVKRFYSAASQTGEIPEVIQINRDYGTRLPSDCVAIGFDVLGNEILLVVSGEDTGRVLFWDHEEEGFEEPPEDPYHNVYELTPNLETLVAVLGPCPPLDSE